MGVLERIGRGRLVVLVMLVVGLAGAGFATWYRLARRVSAGAAATRAIPGESDRVQVEVLNAVPSADPAVPSVGLARIATRRLRDAGLDVVYFGNDAGPPLDSTEILLRRGEQAAADRVRRSLGVGVVRRASDATRLVDVTVRLGRDFATLARNP